MQFKFLLAFMLVGACFIQVTTAHPSSQEVNRNIIDDLIKQVQEAIAKLQASIEEKINEALQTINEIKEQVTAQIQQAIEEVKKQLQEVINKAKQAIQDIVDQAQQAGTDISECVADNEDRFQALFEKFLADEVECVTKELTEIMRIITDAVQMINDAYETVTHLPEKLNGCLSDSKPITCINNVAKEVADLAVNLPAKIAAKINEISKYVIGLEARLKICATTQLASAGIETANIVADVAKCAAEKGVQ